MKMWKWMGLIGALAILIWLSVPAIRIWRDPRLRSHRDTIRSLDPLRNLFWTSDDSNPSRAVTVATANVSIEHRVPFWERYRTLLFEHGRSPGEGCADVEALRSQIRLEGLDQEETIRSLRIAESISIIK